MQPEIHQFLDQAQAFEQQMRDAQTDLEKAVVTGRSQDRTVTVLAGGLGKVFAVRVNPSVFDHRDVQALQNAITEAIGAAADKASELAEQKMGPIEVTLH